VLKKTQRAGLLLLGVTLFLIGGCGYKTAPVPPDTIVPRAIEDLQYSVTAKGVILKWTFPEKTIKGTDLTDIGTFDLYRAVVPLDDYCASCPIPFTEALQVDGGVVDPEQKREGTYETELLQSGRKYFFKVTARTSWLAASADSNIVSFVWHTPASAPQGLSSRAADTSATISWQPVTTLMDGQQVDYPLMYQVQRSKGNGAYVAIGDPTADTSFVDNTLLNGELYNYKIRAILMVEGNAVDGGISEGVSVTPVDLTPPAAPVGVRAVQFHAGIKIFWEKSQDVDVKGYRIYRRGAKEDIPVLIGEVAAVINIFNDTNVPADTSFYYSVTAFDQMEMPNESNKSREAGVRH